MNACYIPDTVLGTRDIAVSKSGKISLPSYVSCILVGEDQDKQLKYIVCQMVTIQIKRKYKRAIEMVRMKRLWLHNCNFKEAGFDWRPERGKGVSCASNWGQNDQDRETLSVNILGNMPSMFEAEKRLLSDAEIIEEMCI